MTYPTNPPYPSVDNVEDFLDIVSELFDRITYPWSELLFKQPLRERIRTAWEMVKDKIFDIKNQFTDLSMSALEDAGLIGEPLNLKFDGFNNAFVDFLNNGTIPLLKKLLGWINLILGSIASVIPAGETLKELKETLEKLIDENNI